MINSTFLKTMLMPGLLALVCAIKPAMGQDKLPEEHKGTVYGTIYSNLHTSINEDESESGFEISRAYLGYKRNISEHFGANIKLDIGSPEDLSEYSRIRRYAYFKNAYLEYRNKSFSASFGIIDMQYFKLYEKIWAHRYIEKTFADNYGFGYSADLGAEVSYDFSDWLEADLTISNGEGYTQLQKDNSYKTSMGITVKPGYNLITRVYYDFTSKSATMSTVSGFVGYQLEDKILGGIEYHYRFNDGYTEGNDMFGYSAYASWYFIKKWQIFGRYDKRSSNLTDEEGVPWDLEDDGTKIIAGIEFDPIKAVKLSINYQDWYPYAQNAPNKQYLFLNIEVSF